MKEFLGLLTLGTLGWLVMPFVFFAICLAIATQILWLWMLIEVLTRETDDGNTRLVWTLVIIFCHWLGALIYLLVRRSERIRRYGR